MSVGKTPTKGAIARARNRVHILSTAAHCLEDETPELAKQVHAEAEKALAWLRAAEKQRGE